MLTPSDKKEMEEATTFANSLKKKWYLFLPQNLLLKISKIAKSAKRILQWIDMYLSPDSSIKLLFYLFKYMLPFHPPPHSRPIKTVYFLMHFKVGCRQPPPKHLRLQFLKEQWKRLLIFFGGYSVHFHCLFVLVTPVNELFIKFT